MKSISEEIAKLSRSFADIGKTSKTAATINQKLRDMIGELEGYIIALPAQKDDTDDVGDGIDPEAGGSMEGGY